MPQSSPVAIVGLSCRLPGGVESPDDFWKFLLEKKSGHSDFPPSRLNIDAWYHPEAVRPGSIVSRGGYFVKHDLDDFDHTFFNISAIETSLMDPAQKQLLEVAYEAIESAGLSWKEISGSKTGVYVGNMGFDQALMGLKETEHLGTYTSTGITGPILSNRINYIFDLLGPSLTVDTACSSSLYALHLACRGLQNGDCESALVCAPNAIRSVEAQLFSSKLGALSPTSQCHTFDASADGYARADGFGALYIMRLDDAVRQGRPVRAVIRATAVGANGHGSGLTHPESFGQAAVIRQAYKSAGISDLNHTGYFECHGTGTPVGDPIETHSISSVFADSRPADDPLLIGSVKTNMGHGEGSAGITAVIKMVLALENDRIPATIGVKNLNPAIKFDEWKLKVVVDDMPWPSNLPVRRASINSFGYGGANAHVILEGPETVPVSSANLLSPNIAGCIEPSTSSSTTPSDQESSTPPTSISDGSSSRPEQRLLVCTAKTEASLERTVETVRGLLATTSVADVAYSLSRKDRFSHRAAAIVEPGVEPVFRAGIAPPADPQVDFVFTGQGAQWPKMGEELLQFPAFRTSMAQADAALAALPMSPEWTLTEMLQADLTASEMDEPRVAQVMSIALEVAIVDLLASWGVKPTMVMGHSAGEIAAGYAAGYLTMAEAIAVAYYRGKAVSDTTSPPGAMLAVGVSQDQARTLIPTGANVVVGAVNSPRSVTLSGDANAIEELKKKLDQDNVFNRLVATKGRAYHSTFMLAAAEAYDVPLQQLPRAAEPPQIRARYFSTVTGEEWTQREIPFSYWRRNMEQPVLFHQALTAMRLAGSNMVIEVGPHSTLRSPILDVIKAVDTNRPFSYLFAQKRKESGVRTALNLCQDLALAGCDLHIDHINGGGCLLPHFPSYQWDHTMKYVKTIRADDDWRRRKFPRHDLLGSLQPGSAQSVRIWRNVLSILTIPWLADHKVGRNYIFPAAGFMSMAVEAMKQVREGPGDLLLLENVHIGAAMMVEHDIEVFLTMRKLALGDTANSATWWEFDISSFKNDISTQHAKGKVGSVESVHNSHSTTPLARADAALGQHISQEDWYDKITQSKGLSFGTSFRRLSKIVREQGEHRAEAEVAIETTPAMTQMQHESQYTIHPTVLDSCLQLSVLAAGEGDSDQAYVPVSVDQLAISEDLSSNKSARVLSNGRYVGFKGLYGAAQVISDTGATLVHLENLRFVGIPAGDESGPPYKPEPFWRLAWDDDYDSIRREDDQLYFPDEKYWPKQYDYPRADRVYLAQMVIKQFSAKYPDLMTMEPVSTETKHFIEWARWLVGETAKDHPDMDKMSIEERHAAIEAERPRAPPGFELPWALYDNLVDIISGKTTALEVATQDHILSRFYETQLIYDKFERAVEVMGFKNPNMDILELGAGTGSATRLMLKSLTKGGSKRYSSLTYTDISSGFFSTAEMEFSEYEDIDFKVYDMERDPEDQNMEPFQYDMVVASCTVHVTADVVSTLCHIRRLLKPGGKILLSEITAEWHDQTFSLGLFPGFYKGYEDGRTRHPFLSPEQWGEAFVQSGFSALELSINDIAGDFGFTVLSAEAVPLDPAAAAALVPRSETITVVHGGSPTPVSACIEKRVQELGLKVQHRALVDAQALQSEDWLGSNRIIVLAELESYIWPTIQESAYKEFQKMMRAASSIVWVTQGGLMENEHPEAALINGFLQCLDINPDLSVASMDFETTAPQDDNMARQILHRESIMKQHGNRDKQFRQHKGKWQVSRLVPYQQLIDDHARAQGSDKSTVMTPLEELGPVQISTADPGRLSALYFKADHSFDRALSGDQVEVQIKAVGMNMNELSSLTGGYDTDDFSSEIAGVVTKIGPTVQSLAVGDRIFALQFGKFGNCAQISETLCQKSEDPQHSFADLASMPTSYGTALYALDNVARIRPGESVLIQTATGGFGLAAITVARLRGAEVFCTAGTEQKRQYLQEHMGVPSDHIFSSRDLSAITHMRAATRGRGFDVVLNTSARDYLHSVSWPSVAPYGRFIELKMVDILDNGHISLRKFTDGVSFSGIDMHQICRNRPDIVAELMKAAGTLYNAGQIKPLPVTAFPLSQITDAYNDFSRFTHIGKLVLTYEPKDTIAYVPSPSQPRFRSDAAYLVIGGLAAGSIGGRTSRWMVEQGAKNIVFLNRSPVNEEAQQFLDSIKKLGGNVTTIEGSVSVREDVHRALTATGLPVAGILNAALVLRNMEINKLTVDEVHETFAPKVAGNIILHELCLELGHTLDFFVMLSSLTSISHAATQSSYSAANCFMDVFAYWRRKQGLAATSIPMGVIGGVGFMARHEHNMQHLKRNGHYTTSAEELMALYRTALFRPEELEPLIAIGTEPRRLGALVESGAVPVPLWERDARWDIIGVHALKKGRRGAVAASQAAKGDVMEMVRERLSKLLWIPVEKLKKEDSLAALGIDSMITSEFRHWTFQTFQKNVSIMDLLAPDMTIEALVELLKD